jgi:hypothetical protein
VHSPAQAPLAPAFGRVLDRALGACDGTTLGVQPGLSGALRMASQAVGRTVEKELMRPPRGSFKRDAPPELNLRKVTRAAREGNADELARAIQEQVDLGHTRDAVVHAETGGWVRASYAGLPDSRYRRMR